MHNNRRHAIDDLAQARRGAARLRRLLIGGFLVLALFDVGFTAFEVHESYQAQFESAERESLARARAVSAQVGRVFAEVHRMLADARGDLAITGGARALGTPELLAHLGDMAARLPVVEDIFIADARGGARWIREDTPDAASQPAMRRLAESAPAPGGALMVADPRPGAVLIAIPLGEGAGSGLIGARLAMERAQIDTAHLLPGAGGRAAVFLRDGTMIAAWPAWPDDARRMAWARAVLSVAGATGARTGALLDDAANHTVAHDTMSEFPLLVSVAVASEAYMAHWREEQGEQLALAALVLVALAAVLVMLLRELGRAERREARLYLTQFSIDQARDLVVWLDERGHMRMGNLATAERMGCPAAKLVGLPVAQLLPEVGPGRWSRLWRQLGAAREVRFETPARDWKEATAPFDVVATMVDLPGERLCCLMCRDMSERQRNDEALRALNESLETRVQERTMEMEAALKELEAFSYSVSHDLRSPLRAINGFASILLQDYGTRLDEAARGHLERLRAAATRMSDLIDGLLELSRISRHPIRRGAVDLCALAHEILDELSAAEPGRVVEANVHPRLVAHADATLVRSLLHNLLSNAWKYTARRADARIELGVVGNEAESIFFVRDNGVGFDMAYADKLFGAFQRLHAVGEFDGIGIGLATVRRIVLRHGGRIWAESAPDEGATFYFTL